MILVGDAIDRLKEIPAATVQTCVTSPPYWGLRNYGVGGQLGLEKTPEEYVAKLVSVFREVKRVLTDDGTLWLNLGDSYNGSQQTGGTNSLSGIKKHQPHGGILKQVPGLKSKDLVGIPWRVAFALQADGWYLRSDIIWHKPNPMPESVRDRPTKSHEYIFLMAKSSRYYYDADAIKEPAKADYSADGLAGGWATARVPNDNRRRKRYTRDQSGSGDGIKGHSGYHKANGEIIGDGKANKRSVWTITTKSYSGDHFATFPPEIPELCIKAGSKPGDTVLDPFAGSGTTLIVAKKLFRKFIGIELNPKYADELIAPRLADVDPLFAEASKQKEIPDECNQGYRTTPTGRPYRDTT